jgi:hypothetical protein
MFPKEWRLLAPEGVESSTGGGGKAPPPPLPEDRGDTNQDDDDDDAATGKADPKGSQDDPDDPDAKAAGTDDDDDPKAGDKRDKRIKVPKARLDQEIAKRRAAEDRALAAEGKVNARSAAADVVKMERDLAELDDKYDTAISDGDKAEAKKLKTEMRVIERQISRAESSADAARAQYQAVDTLKYDMLLERLEERHPVLNEDSDEFDKEVASEVVDLMAALQKNGLSRTDALKRAVKYVVREAPDKKDEGTSGLRTKDQRAEDTKKRALDAIARTPGDNRRVGKVTAGAEAAARTVAQMSQSEFAKMDDAALAKLRGDEI